MNVETREIWYGFFSQRAWPHQVIELPAEYNAHRHANARLADIVLAHLISGYGGDFVTPYLRRRAQATAAAGANAVNQPR